MATLETWDYVSGCSLIALTSCLGLYHVFRARKEKRAHEFLFSAPDLGVGPIMLSSMATFVSGIMMIGFPAESYTHGVTYVLWSLAVFLTGPILAHLYLPVFLQTGNKTIFEYLEHRFNSTIRMIASVLFTTVMVLHTSVAIYAPSLALDQVTGLSFWGSVLTTGGICILYSSMGGIKAVVWADTVQAVLMIAITVIIVVKGSLDVGGPAEVWRIGTQSGRLHLKFFDDGSAYYTVWTLVIGGTIYIIGYLGTNQMLIQRYRSLPNLRTAQRCLYGSIVILVALYTLSGFTGLVMYAKYSQCDPLLDKKVASRDQIMALFAMETLSFAKGMPGLFVAALLSATLSTLSSCLNSVAAIVVEDYVRPFRPTMSDSTVIRLSKITAIACGMVCMACVAVARSLGGVMKAAFSMQGICGGPIMALFTTGMLVPWVNAWGAMAGCVVGILFTTWAFIGSMLTNPPIPTAPMTTVGCNVSSLVLQNSSFVPAFSVGNETTTADTSSGFWLYAVSPLWYASWNCAIMLIVAPLVSLFFRPKTESMNPDLFFPIVNKLMRHLPKNCQRWLGLKPGSETHHKQWTQLSERNRDKSFQKCLPNNNGHNEDANYNGLEEANELEPMTKTLDS